MRNMHFNTLFSVLLVLMPVHVNAAKLFDHSQQAATEVFLGDNRVVTICPSQRSSDRACKSVKMPTMVGDVKSIKLATPLRDLHTAWYAYSVRNVSMCASGSNSNAVVCTRIRPPDSMPAANHSLIKGVQGSLDDSVKAMTIQMGLILANARDLLIAQLAKHERSTSQVATLASADGSCYGDYGGLDDIEYVSDSCSYDSGGWSDSSVQFDPLIDILTRAAKLFYCLQECDNDTFLLMESCWNAYSAMSDSAGAFAECEALAVARGAICRAKCIF